ncbi:MAG: EAL domain-containing protein [Gammaproteobacteria bacterium]|nr:EAL domain-containing protein [Gammaproteobacteria bacterium]
MTKITKTLALKYKLVLLFIIGIAASLLCFHFFLFNDIRQQLNLIDINEAISDARSTVIEGYENKAFENSESASRYIKYFESIDSVQLAALLSSNKSLLAIYNKDNDEQLVEIDPKERLTIDDKEVQIFEPVLIDNKIAGYLYIIHNKDKLNHQSEYYYFKIIMISTGLIIFLFLLANLFQRYLYSPVKHTVEILSQIYKTGDYSKRITKISRDEIGILGHSLNKFLDIIQNRKEELTVRSEQLKKLVDVRTEQLYQKAHFDPLTRLPNRYLLVDRLNQAISKSTRSRLHIALLFLDLDRFKVINDNLGHQNGDQLLKEVAKRLHKVSRQGDTVARLGGDEFIFLLENLNSPEDAAKTARRIIECFKQPFKIQQHILHVSTSIGISIYPNDGRNEKSLLKNADVSMYHAKKLGPGNYSFYSKDMNESSMERLAIESSLRSAIANNELTMVYQPQFSIKQNCYKNAEALIRWKNPKLGQVSPGIFIPIAEETGLINQIDLWTVKQACNQLRIWKEKGLTDITIAVNVSAGHLISNTLLELLKKEIISNQINAHQIEIEITEAVFVEHTEQTIKALKAFKKLGVKIAIDDFGTGYSSLQYIQNFPTDTLKLDGMFIKNLLTKKASKGIVRSTIILAHSLGLELVAEGVENQEEFDFLKENDCDLIQGYLLAKPMPPEQAFEFIQQANSEKESA